MLSDDASLYLKERLTAIVTDKPKNFGNARFVRNIFEKAIENQSNRLASVTELTKDDLSLITKMDLLFEDFTLVERTGNVSLNHDSYIEAKCKLQQTGEVSDHDMKDKISIAGNNPADNSGMEKLLTSTYSYQNDDIDDETIQVSYTITDEDMDETACDVDIKWRDYEWLSIKNDEGEYLDSEYISENRRGLHKRILRAIREDESIEGIVDFVDDDDIEYIVDM